jgi:hypothetical protein
MTDYASRIASLESERARLAQREIDLTVRRREEIGRLFEKLGVLEVEDAVLAGVLIELKSAIDKQSPHLAQWRDAGARFRSGRPPRHGANAAPDANGPDKA